MAPFSEKIQKFYMPCGQKVWLLCAMGFYATGAQLLLCRNTDALLDHLRTLWRREPALEPLRIAQAPWKMAEMLEEPVQLQ